MTPYGGGAREAKCALIGRWDDFSAVNLKFQPIYIYKYLEVVVNIFNAP